MQLESCKVFSFVYFACFLPSATGMRVALESFLSTLNVTSKDAAAAHESFLTHDFGTRAVVALLIFAVVVAVIVALRMHCSCKASSTTRTQVDSDLLETLFYLGVYMAVAAAMNVANKKVSGLVPATLLIVVVQMAIAAVAIFPLEYHNFHKASLNDVLKWSIIPVLFSGMLSTSMYCFAEMSMSSVLILRNILPFLTLAAEKVAWNIPQRLSPLILFSMTLLVGGTLLYGAGELHDLRKGGFALLINCLFTVADRLGQRKLLTGAGFTLSTGLCALINNTFAIVPICLLALYNGEIWTWRQTLVEMDQDAWVNMLGSSVLGCTICYFALASQKRVSATTFLMAQNAIKVIVLMIGICFLGDRFNQYKTIGTIISFVGVAWYGYLRLPAEVKENTERTKEQLERHAPSTATREGTSFLDSDFAETIFFLGVYMAAAAAMNVANKKVSGLVPATLLIVAVQMVVAAIAILPMEYQNFQKASLRDVLKWSIIPILFSGMLSTSMYCFAEMSMSSVLILRNILPFVTLAAEKAAWNIPKHLSPLLLFSMTLLVGGTVLYGAGELKDVYNGGFALLVNCLFTVADRLGQRKLLTGAGFTLSTGLCALINNAFAIVPICLLALYNGEIWIWKQTLLEMNQKAWVNLLGSSVLGCTICYFALASQKRVSATTFLMAQNAIKVIVLMVGIFVLGDRFNQYKTVGTIISFVGVAWYGYLRLPAEVLENKKPKTEKHEHERQVADPNVEQASKLVAQQDVNCNSHANNLGSPTADGNASPTSFKVGVDGRSGSPERSAL